MKVGKLKKQKDLFVNQVNQNITEDQSSVIKNPDKASRRQRARKKIEQASPDTIGQLLQSLFAQVEGYAQYNQVADTSTYLSSDQDFSEEEIAALKFDNRTRIKTLVDDIAKVTKQVDKKIDAVNHQYEYDADIPELSVTAYLLFGKVGSLPVPDNFMTDTFGSVEVDSLPGRLTQKQVDELDLIVEQFASMKADQQVAKFNKKANRKKKEDLDIKYESLISRAISYESAKPFVFSMYQGYDMPPNPKLALVTNPLIWPGWPNKVGVIEDFDLQKDASTLQQNIKDNKGSLPEEFHPDVFLIPLKEQIKTLTQTTTGIQQTLSTIDDQNSFVDRIFSGKEPIKIRKPGGIEESFDMDQLEQCWDCFASKWEDPEFKKDFECDFKLEFKFNKLIASLEAKWDKMKAALDIPYIVQQNYCSLMRLGSLCPTEILMLLAALTGMAIFTWEELFSSFSFSGLGASVGGYLGLLFFNGFLKPILTALELTGKFSIGPINYYAGCTVNSLVKIQDIDKYTGQYGLKTEEALDWFSNSFDSNYTDEEVAAYNKGVDDRAAKAKEDKQRETKEKEKEETKKKEEALKKGEKYTAPFPDFIETGPVTSEPYLQNKVRSTMMRSYANMARSNFVEGNASDPKTQDVLAPLLEKSKALLEESELGRDRFMSTLLNPLLQNGSLDVLELFIGVIKDFAEKIKAQEGIISTALQGIDELFSGDSFGASTALISKLAGLGHLIGVVKGLYDLAEKGIEPCLKMPIETPNGIIYTNESPFTEEEIREMTGNTEPVYYTPSVITRPDGTSTTEPGQAYIYNPITDRRFNLTNCNAAKSSIISRGESLEFWKRVSLGKNVDNV